MFYKISWPTDGKYAECLEYSDVYTSEPYERCPYCSRRLTGRYWNHPRTLQISNSRYADFLFPVPYPAVSEHFKDLYEASDLKGILEFDPIEDYKLRKNAPQCPRYYTIKTVWSKMKVDFDKSDISWLNSTHDHTCSVCDPYGKCTNEIKALILKEEDYHGEDIFRLYATCEATYVSEKFIQFVKDNGLTNLGINPLSNMEETIVINDKPKRKKKNITKTQS